MWWRGQCDVHTETGHDQRCQILTNLTWYCCCFIPSNRQDYMVSSMNMLDNKQVLLKSCNNLMTIGDIVDKWWWLMIIMINLIILIMVPDKLTTLDAKRSLSSSVDCTFVSENVWDYEEHLVELHFNQAMTFGLTKYWKNFENLSIWGSRWYLVIFGFANSHSKSIWYFLICK